eukprot:m.605607 g.605607  ORF g.605607 m.605607 type:complete len:271 (-) comp22466_c0_seq1:2546-3358(-)
MATAMASAAVAPAASSRGSREETIVVHPVLSAPNAKLNQYFYSDETLDALSTSVALRANFGQLKSVAFVSAPSAFFKFVSAGLFRNVQLLLLEYDDRFAAEASQKGEFLKYDYNENPMVSIPETYKGKFDLVICDPPYLSRECWTSFHRTAEVLKTPETGCLLYCSIPDNEPLLRSLVDPDNSHSTTTRAFRTMNFVPVQLIVAHRFRFFTTLPLGTDIGCPLEISNATSDCVRVKEPGAADDVDDDVDALFEGLKDAVISSLVHGDDGE